MEVKVQDDQTDKPMSCWSRCKKACALTKPNATPVNWKMIGLVFVPLLGSCYSITFLFPFLPDMILYFGYKEEEKGYYAGLLASAMFAGRILTSYFWGWVADRKGRKPVLLISLSLVALTNLGFGFVPSLTVGIVLRFLNGLSNGVVVVVKTILYEVCDNTNQAVGMSAISLGWGTGVVLGPLVSGYLALPADKYPEVLSQEGTFGRFPFLLPALVATLVTGGTILPVWLLLPETLQKHVDDPDVVITVESETPGEGDKLMAPGKGDPQSDAQRPGIPLPSRQAADANNHAQYSALHPKAITALSGRDEVEVTSRLSESENDEVNDLSFIDDVSMATDDVNRMYGLGVVHPSIDDLCNPALMRLRSRSRSRSLRSITSARPKSVASEAKAGSVRSLPRSAAVADPGNDRVTNGYVVVATTEKEEEEPKADSCCDKLRRVAFFRLCSISDVRMSVSLYTLLSFAVIGFDEVFTVWASTEEHLGGLAFTSEKIGNAIGLSSIPLMLLNVILFPIIESKIGAKRTFQYFCLYMIVCSTMTACLRFLAHDWVWLWTMLMISTAGLKSAGVICFSCVCLFINNSTSPKDTGTVNGMGMMFTAIGRTLAPTVGGSIFAWSIVDGVLIGFPFDVNLVFIIFGAVYLAANILCALLPESLNRQKKSQGPGAAGRGSPLPDADPERKPTEDGARIQGESRDDKGPEIQGGREAQEQATV